MRGCDAESIRYLDVHYLDLSSSSNASAPALKASYDALLTPLLLNSALSALRVNTPAYARLALQSASRALKLPELPAPERAKALYRGALAHAMLKEDEDAERDLVEAAGLVPEDQAVAAELAKVKARIKAKKDNEKKKFKKMFA